MPSQVFSAEPIPATTELTAKGQRTRSRILDAATELIERRGLAGTTIDDVKLAAGVSSSQLYHYFADKEALVHAVVERQGQLVVTAVERAEVGTTDGLRAWRDELVAHAHAVSGAGGCPLGQLAGQLAEADPAARDQLAASFARWADVLRAALRQLAGAGRLRPGVDPNDVGDTLLATVQGGLLLAQIRRDAAPLATALDTLISLVVIGDDERPDGPAPSA